MTRVCATCGREYTNPTKTRCMVCGGRVLPKRA